MHGATPWRPNVRLTLVLTLTALVYVGQLYAGQLGAPSALAQSRSSAGTTKPSAGSAKPKAIEETVPRAVADMVDTIQSAVRSGRLAELNDAVDWNEMKPDLGPAVVSDPVAHWKSISRDGEGRDILEILGKLLAGKPTVRRLGKDIENNRLYVWPSFADTPLSKLSVPETDALTALVQADRLAAMRDKDRYDGWRLVLGADGTWHSFRQD